MFGSIPLFPRESASVQGHDYIIVHRILTYDVYGTVREVHRRLFLMDDRTTSPARPI